MSPAVNMLATVFLSVLLMMLGGLGGTAASDLQVYGKSIHKEDGRHTARRHFHQQTKSEIRRSLDLENFNMHVSPTTSKISLPSIIKLYPPTAKPLHLHANMPMRFGRESDPVDDRAPNSIPNMPQRFGRSWEVNRMCAGCSGVRQAPNQMLPQRFGRSNLYWRLLRTIANNTGLHWPEDFDFTVTLEEVEKEEKSYKG